MVVNWGSTVEKMPLASSGGNQTVRGVAADGWFDTSGTRLSWGVGGGCSRTQLSYPPGREGWTWRGFLPHKSVLYLAFHSQSLFILFFLHSGTYLLERSLFHSSLSRSLRQSLCANTLRQSSSQKSPPTPPPPPRTSWQQLRGGPALSTALSVLHSGTFTFVSFSVCFFSLSQSHRICRNPDTILTDSTQYAD